MIKASLLVSVIDFANDVIEQAILWNKFHDSDLFRIGFFPVSSTISAKNKIPILKLVSGVTNIIIRTVTVIVEIYI